MSNSNDIKGGVRVDKLEPHPDFEELLKAEQSRVTPASNKNLENNEASNLKDSDLNLDLDNEFNDLDGFDDHDHDEDDDQEEHHDFSDESQKDLKDGLTEKPELANGDMSEFSDIERTQEGLDSGTELDDSMEFNFDDTSVASVSNEAPNGKSGSNAKKDPVKKSSGLIFYIVIGVVVVVVGAVGYSFIHKGSRSAPQNAQVGTGFKPVLPVVHALPNTLPPAIPQSLKPVSTTVMEGSSNEQILTGTAQSYSSGAGAVTMLQVNKQQLVELLANFQAVVDKNSKSMTEEVSSLKSSLGAINSSDSQLSQGINDRLQQVNSQISMINQKFDTYNHAIAGVQSALEKTQDQLKLILAQRAEDIDHYTLRAIVPGRAWLVDGEGNTVTIVMGQEIKNYGTVQEINDKMGYVTMSSGFIFK